MDIYDIFKVYEGYICNSKFRLDPWVCDKPLREVFPKLFKMEKCKKSLVSDFYNSEHDSLEGFWTESSGLWSEEEIAEKISIEMPGESEIGKRQRFLVMAW